MRFLVLSLPQECTLYFVRRRQLLQNHERGNFTIFQSEYPFHRSSSRRRFVRVSETLVA